MSGRVLSGFTSQRTLPPRRTNLGSCHSQKRSYNANPAPIRRSGAALPGTVGHRPIHCPQCQAKDPLIAHGFYTRTIVDDAFDGAIRVRRYLCQACRRTVSPLPEFALPYLRSRVSVIALFLIARLLHAKTLAAALPPSTPYQRGRFWLRRFGAQAEALCAALAAMTNPAPAPSFIQRALAMLESSDWIPAHRFLFASLRQHLLGWPPSLVPTGRRTAIIPAAAPA